MGKRPLIAPNARALIETAYSAGYRQGYDDALEEVTKSTSLSVPQSKIDKGAAAYVKTLERALMMRGRK